MSQVILEPELGGPHTWEIFAAATYPMRPGGSCAQYPVNAIEDLPPGGALLVIQEPRVGREGAMLPRPESFPPSPLSSGDDSAACLARPKTFEHYSLEFRDRGRGFYAYVAFGAEATERRKSELWSILDSFSPG